MPYPGEHRGVDAVIERLVRVRHRDQQAFFRSDDRSQNRLGRVEVREDERCIFSLVAFDITQQARGMGRCRFVERPFVFIPDFHSGCRKEAARSRFSFFRYCRIRRAVLYFLRKGLNCSWSMGCGLKRGVGGPPPPKGAGSLRRNSETFLCYFLLVTKESRSSREAAVPGQSFHSADAVL